MQHDELPESEVVEAKLPCPNTEECSSSDAYHLYSDGHGHCFSCGYHKRGEGEGHGGHQPEAPRGDWERFAHTPRELRARRISERTCRKFGYGVYSHFDRQLQVCDVRDQGGQLVAQKCRSKDKDFFVQPAGALKAADILIGMHLWGGGKRIVITEGEIDMLSYAEATDCKYPVVSLPQGAQSAKKVLGNCREYLEKFGEVVLWFDNDEPGRKATEECLPLFAPDHVKYTYATGEAKDANDMLKAGDIKAMINCVFNAESWKPEGLVSMADIMDDILLEPEVGIPYWDERLTALTYGRQEGQVIFLGAGTGVGKTDWFTQQMSFDLNVMNEKVAAFYLEMPPAELSKRVAGKAAGQVFHVPGECDTTALRDTVKRPCFSSENFQMYDSFGCSDWDVMEGQMRYLVSLGFNRFYIDHLTALATGEDKEERVELEAICAAMAKFAQKYKVILHVISHLATPEKGSHEEGARVTIRQFKGSRAIGFWAHFMFALERDQQSGNGVTTFRILKDRVTGRSTGKTLALDYKHETGMLIPTDFPSDDGDGFTDETETPW